MREPLAVGTRLGPYEIDVLIGAGGMGEVYRARDTRLGRHVAIKTMSGLASGDPDRIRRFETEARAAGALDHPNVLVVYDVGREGEISYIVSELLKGETLRARVQEGAVPPRQAADYLAQIARGLAAAHDRGIVHRDLKPDNLFITADGRVKILDFGVAKLSAPTGDDATTTIEPGTGVGTIVGTAAYMAPEQILGEPFDHRADIFAVGVVMHEMLSGTHPFGRDTVPETLTAILRDDPPGVPATAPPGLVRIARRCLEKRPGDRFHSAHDLAIAIELLSGTTGTAAPLTTSGPSRVSRRAALAYGASSLGLLAAGAGGAALAGRRGSAAAPPVSSFRRLTFRRGLIRSARLAPDGLSFLCGALWDGMPCRVHSGRLDGPESGPLDFADANVLAVSRSGEVALATGGHMAGVITYGTLARAPLAGGAPRELAENVKFADWSPDGRDLAIVRLVDGVDQLEYPVGTPLVRPDPGGHTGLGFPRISPDGNLVAFIHYRTPGSLFGRVMVADKAGKVTQLSDEYVNIHGLAWRGNEVWYTAAADGPLFRAVCAVAPASTPRTVARMLGNATLWDATRDGRLLIAQTDDRATMIAHTDDNASDRDLSWFDASWVADISDDGRVILFTEVGQGGGTSGTVYLRPTDGSPAVRIGNGLGLSLSPDKRWALCAPSALDGMSPSPYLELVPTGAGDVRRLPSDGLGYSAAKFLPGGRRILGAGVQGGRSRLYVLDLDGNRRAVTPEGLNGWALSPDGSLVAAQLAGAPVRLYPLDGSAPRDIPGLSASDRPAGWIHDGLLITRPIESGAALGDIYKVDPTTGRQEFWKNIRPRDAAGIMALVSFRVTPDGRSQAYSWHRALTSLYIADGLA